MSEPMSPFEADAIAQAAAQAGDPRRRTPLPPFAPSVVDRFPGDFKGEIRNRAPRPAPWSRGIEETVSPTLNAYGAGQMAAEGALAAREGDYGTAAMNAILIGMPGLRRLEGAGMRKPADWGGSARLAEAEAMRKAGASPADTWREHGWSDNAYGQQMDWHTAIDDGPAKPSEMWGKSGASIGTQYDHPELYAAYPDVAKAGLNTTVGSAASGVSGGTTPNSAGNRDYRNNFGAYPKSPFGISVEAYSRDQAVPVLTHELQHGVAAVEPGIPQGSYRGQLPSRYDTEQVRNIQTHIDQEKDPTKRAQMEARREDAAMWAAYLNQIGEVVARGEGAIKARGLPKETPRQHEHVDTFDLRDHVDRDTDLRRHKAD